MSREMSLNHLITTPPETDVVVYRPLGEDLYRTPSEAGTAERLELWLQQLLAVTSFLSVRGIRRAQLYEES